MSIKMKFNIKEPYKTNLIKYYNEIIKNHTSKRLKWIKENPLDKKTYNYIEDLYLQGYGFKLFSRELNISYSRVRTLLSRYLKIKVRKGYNICTEKTREFRKKMAKEENPWTNWPEKNPDMHKTTKRGIGGYYKTKKGNYVYFRSTWEYIYGKWLDNQNLNWGIEDKQFKLKDGTNYLPDFFIYDKNNNLIKIVEIKGYHYNDRSFKALELNDILSIEVIMITNIQHYTQNIKEDYNIWKQIRLTKEELLEKELNQ